MGADVLGGVVCTLSAYACRVGNVFAAIEAAVAAIANVSDALIIVSITNSVLVVILQVLQNMFYKYLSMDLTSK